MTPVSCYMYI